MNTKLLRKVQKAILAAPDQFEMNWFFRWCGGASCIAGWAIHINGKAKNLSETRNQVRVGYEWKKACQLLKLTEPKALRLFLQPEWPNPFKRNYIAAKLPVTRAKVAAARITHFIKTKGRE